MKIHVNTEMINELVILYGRKASNGSGIVLGMIVNKLNIDTMLAYIMYIICEFRLRKTQQ